MFFFICAPTLPFNLPVDGSVPYTQGNKIARIKDIRLLKDHPTDAMIRDITEGLRTRSKKGVDYN